MKPDILLEWSKQELRTYLFIFCINADCEETDRELALVKSKVDNETYIKMHTEFERDNDYKSIQKIKNAIKYLGYEKEGVQKLFDEIKDLFLSDGKFNILERNLMSGLKRLLS